MEDTSKLQNVLNTSNLVRKPIPRLSEREPKAKLEVSGVDAIEHLVNSSVCH